MKLHKIKTGITLSALSVVVLFACKKYKDPPATGGDDRLTNKYCNDSRAVNYNWGFPGKPDNTICIYPVDSFLGSWLFTDSVFLPDGSLQTVQTKTLSFTATEDTVMTHMSVVGWCGNIPFFVNANKYRLAYVDTLEEGVGGQLLCATLDTLSGTFNKNTGFVNTMKIDLTIINASGTTFHRGEAVKQ
jgi:hypothetical protein